jgi:hypothetical protein
MNRQCALYKTTEAIYMISRKTPPSNMDHHRARRMARQARMTNQNLTYEHHPDQAPHAADRDQWEKHRRPFSGDRSQAENFISEVKAYIRLNQETALGQSPRRKIKFVLTFMQGPEVCNWAATIGNWLDTLGEHENIPAVWEAFLDQFFYRFQDTTAQEDARQALTKIRITWPDIDQYVADFEELVRKAGYDLNTPSIIDAFLHGLPQTTIKDLIGGTPIKNYYDLRKRTRESIGSHQNLIRLLGIPAHRAPSPEETPKEARKTIKCFTCQQEGHKRSQCPQKVLIRRPSLDSYWTTKDNPRPLIRTLNANYSKGATPHL